jgi:hypothetical protein
VTPFSATTRSLWWSGALPEPRLLEAGGRRGMSRLGEALARIARAGRAGSEWAELVSPEGDYLPPRWLIEGGF